MLILIFERMLGMSLFRVFEIFWAVLNNTSSCLYFLTPKSKGNHPTLQLGTDKKSSRPLGRLLSHISH